MKITIVLGAFLPVPPIMGGAVEKAWFALGQEFARRNHEVTQISRALPQFPREEIIEGVRHLRVDGFDTPQSLVRLKWRDFLYSLRVRKVLPPADILITNTFWLPILVRDATRGKIYLHVARFPKGQTRFYRNAARLQTPSRAVSNAVAAEAPAMKSRIRTIPYPRPEISDDVSRSFAARPKKMIYVGRVHPEKGVHLLIEAFARLRPNEWTLSIIGSAQAKHGGGGPAYENQLRHAAQSVAAKIEFRGPIFDGARLAEAFLDARLFVYPSLAERGETFGLAPLEAMTYGCATMVSDLACFHDFVREAETGFIFNHRAADPAKALDDKIAQVISDEALLARVAEAGYQKSADYTLARVADQFLADFESVISHG